MVGDAEKPGILGKRQRQANRTRKDEHQIQILLFAFSKEKEWTKEQVATLSEKTGLTESQVYKWAWDQKKKFQPAEDESRFQSDDDQITTKVTRDEFGGYCCKRLDESPNFEGDICELLGIDIERMALEIVTKDISKRGVPIGALAYNTPHSNSKACHDDLLVSTPSIKTSSETPLSKFVAFQDPKPIYAETRLPAVEALCFTANKSSPVEEPKVSAFNRPKTRSMVNLQTHSEDSSLAESDLELLEEQLKGGQVTPFDSADRSLASKLVTEDPPSNKVQA